MDYHTCIAYGAAFSPFLYFVFVAIM